MKHNFYPSLLSTIFCSFLMLSMMGQSNQQLEIAGDAKINGTLQINNPNTTGYQLPISDGTPYQVLTTDGNGEVDWSSLATTVQNSTINSTAHIGIPAEARALFIKIEGAPSENFQNSPELDNTEIPLVGYNITQFPGGPNSCDNIHFSFTKALDKASPKLKGLNFGGAIIQNVDFLMYLNNSFAGRILEKSIRIEQATISSIRLQTFRDANGETQICEVIDLRIDGSMEIIYNTYDQRGVLKETVGQDFNCADGG